MLGFFNTDVNFLDLTTLQEKANDLYISPYDELRVQVDPLNNWFWIYNNQPTLLVGASSDDDMFQITGTTLTDELDLMVSVGANYLRNVMASSGSGDIKAFLDTGGGVYDLTQWNDQYWLQFDTLLSECLARDIIVQIEIWDRFDYAEPAWQYNEFNGNNNVNYTNAQAGFDSTYPSHPTNDLQPFFHTVPTMDNNTVVLPYQEAFVTKLMSYAINYKNVLFVMDNETTTPNTWGSYWSDFIKNIATTADKTISTTEMWDDRNVSTVGTQHEETWDNIPATYDFTDMSQNNHNTEDTHWANTNYTRTYLQTNSIPAPINATKVYGADGGASASFGDTADAINRFWLCFLGGYASARFHRESSGPYGLGISLLAQKQVIGVREIEALSAWQSRIPDVNHTLLNNRATNEAWLSYAHNISYVLYFYNAGSVILNLNSATGTFILRWLNLDTGEFYGSNINVTAGSGVTLVPPISNSYGFIAVLTRT